MTRLTPSGSRIGGELIHPEDFADDARTRYTQSDAEVLASLGRIPCRSCAVWRALRESFLRNGLPLLGPCPHCNGIGSIRAQKRAA